MIRELKLMSIQDMQETQETRETRVHRSSHLSWLAWVTLSLGVSPLGLNTPVYADDTHETQERREWYRQLTIPQPLTDHILRPLTHRDRRSYVRHTLQLHGRYCGQAKRFNQMAETEFNPERRAYLRQTAEVFAHACGIEVYIGRDQVIGFTLMNDLNNSINPQEDTPHESKRLFNFRFEERLKQNITLKISDHSGVSGRMSSDFMETTLVFIPRRVIPHIQYPCAECTQRQLAVILPTNEEVIFDVVTREIKGGVLEEEKIDIRRNSRRRKFARVTYTGGGITIRADRRGGLPEKIHRRKNNRHEQRRNAIIKYRDQTCTVPKNLIWANTSSERGSHFFKYATDEEFLTKVIRPHCRWELTLADLPR